MTIDILLTVFDGAAFIGEQIRSLQAQTHRDWRLWVRDDASTDATVELVRAMADGDERIRLVSSDGTRLGALGGFAWLMENVRSDAAYAMFCDADDVWLPRKIEWTLAAMRELEREVGAGTPALVHTDLTVVDAELRVLAESFWDFQSLRPELTALNRLLIQNCVTGCAMMMNRALWRASTPVPPEAYMHDWWIALVASCFGRIEHLDARTILYRQHGRNDTGARRHDRRLGTLLRKGLGAVRDAPQIRGQVRRTAAQAGALLERFESRLALPQRDLLRRYSEIPACSAVERRIRLIELGTLPHVPERSLGLLLRV